MFKKDFVKKNENNKPPRMFDVTYGLASASKAIYK